MKTSSTGDNTIFVYDAGGTLIEEYPTSNTSSVSTSYVYAGVQLIATETSSGTSYLTQDHLGSTRAVSDGSGNVIARKDFGAFGDETITPERIPGLGYNPPSTRKDYTGYERDTESGLEFAQARYYNPTHGRFTSIDPLTSSATIRNPQTFNRYSYTLNSPYKFVDPLGLITQWPSFSYGDTADHGGATKEGAFTGSMVDTSFDWATFDRNRETDVGIAAGSHEELNSGQPQAADPPLPFENNEPFVVSNVDSLAQQAQARTHPGYTSIDEDGTVDYECAQLPQRWQNEQEGWGSRTAITTGESNRQRRLIENWSQGEQISYGMNIASGTVAASGWQGGKYVGLRTGNHTLIFHKWDLDSSGTGGMWVIETVHDRPKYTFYTNLSPFFVVMIPKSTPAKFYQPPRDCKTCRFYE